MGFQFGRDKCVKLHVAKSKHKHGCNECKGDAWEDLILEHKGGQEKSIDAYIGKKLMKNVETKKYLGRMISTDLSNKIDIKQEKNMAVGIEIKFRTLWKKGSTENIILKLQHS